MADEKAFDMTTKNRDTSRGPQNLQALRDMARRVLEAVKETGVNLVEGMPAPTMPPEVRAMRTAAQQEAYEEDVRRAEMEDLATQPQILDVPPDEPYEFPNPIMPDGSLVTPDQPPPSTRNKKSIDNPYGG